CQQDHTTFIF
nr:immunoglobulin light chain junction region [Macaca mulatta]MOX90554.1 immunoglobulin light chain junction region [Macaca mulatta]